MQETKDWKALSQSKASKHFYNGYLQSRVQFGRPKGPGLGCNRICELADMCNTNGMKMLLPQKLVGRKTFDADKTRRTLQRVHSATRLPTKHPVRRKIA